jgi:hypothetical protein
MPVKYNQKKIIPAPRVNITKETERREDGSIRRVYYRVTAIGTLVAYKGSPMAGVTGHADGTFWTAAGYPPDTDPANFADGNKRLALLRDKKGALCELFCDKYRLFEIEPLDGSASIKFIPRDSQLSFEEGIWFNVVNYTINMETDAIDFGSFSCCSTNGASGQIPDEQWAIDQADEKGRTYRMTHSLSADARDSYSTDGSGTLLQKGWEIAKNVVTPYLGFAASIRNNSNVLSNLDDFVPYNYVRSENIDITGGKYAATETWLLFDDGAYIEEFTISTRSSIEAGFTAVSIEGTVTGLEIRNNTTHALVVDRWTNAASGFNVVSPLLLNRAQSYSGITLNANVVSNTIGKNPNQGVITYNYEYDNKPCNITENALSETITIQDSLPNDVFAKIPVVVKASGPVFQSIPTRTESRRSLNIEIAVQPATGCIVYATRPNPTGVIAYFGPSGAGGFTYTEGPFIERNEISWNPRSGKYSRNIVWVYN